MDCFVTCCRAITEKSIRGTDTTEDMKAKRYGIPVSIAVIAIFVGFNLDPIDNVAEVGQILATVISAFFLFVAFTNTMSATNALKAILVLCLLTVYTNDWSGASTLEGRWWAVVVIIVDFCLVLEYDFVTRIVVSATCFWFVIESSESAFRYGLYEKSYFSGEINSFMWDCASPPCATGILGGGLIGDFFFYAFVFLTDFYATRSFANGMREQNKRLQSIVDVSRTVTSALARFDVMEATDTLESATVLPEEMKDNYEELIKHLSGYKGSLPLSVLDPHLNTEDQTVELPQFERLQKLFLSLLKSATSGPLTELAERLRSPHEVDKAKRVLGKRAVELHGKVGVLRHLDPVQLLALEIYSMEGPDIDRCAGYDDAPEWLELQQFCPSAEDRKEAQRIRNEYTSGTRMHLSGWSYSSSAPAPKTARRHRGYGMNTHLVRGCT
eukprot:Hpha_TRINITY_DN16979_c1_g1::TRINITY_DN16979_c1_g1_i25::g.54999::m.54999